MSNTRTIKVRKLIHLLRKPNVIHALWLINLDGFKVPAQIADRERLLKTLETPNLIDAEISITQAWNPRKGVWVNKSFNISKVYQVDIREA